MRNYSRLWLLVLPFLSLNAIASPIDDAVAKRGPQKTISSITFKGLPVVGNAGQLCLFLGYGVALDSQTAPLRGGKYYQYQMSMNGGANEFTLADSDGGESVVTSLTCAP